MGRRPFLVLIAVCSFVFFFFSSRRRHTRSLCDWSSDVCSSDLVATIRGLRAAGRTFLLIEHDMDLVTELCDPVIVMAQGRKLMEGPFAEVRRDPRVLEAYLGT